MDEALLQFFFGIRDSLNLKQCIVRYLSPEADQSLTKICMKTLLEKQHSNEHSQIIAQSIRTILRKSFTFLTIVIFLGWIQALLENFIGYYLSNALYWVILGFIYLDHFLQMQMGQQEIGQEVVNMEIIFYKNNSFVEYQLDTNEQDSALEQIHSTFNRILFTLLFQVQTNVFGFIVNISLGFPLNLFIKVPILALFLSMSQYNTKIPYQSHLTYYYDLNLFYLIGLNFFQSVVLHFATFPLFTGPQWALTPFFIMSTISREPPRIKLKEGSQFKQAMLSILTKNEKDIAQYLVVEEQSPNQIPRDTYRNHLKGCFNDPEYQQLCDKHIGYMSIPAMLTPPTARLLNHILTYFDKQHKED